jgi:two-component system LytT family sensor kinase
MRFSINYKVVIQVLIWSILTFFPFIVSNAANHYSIGIVPGNLYVIQGLIHIALFYTQCLYIYPKFWNRRWWWLYVLSAVALIAASLALKYWVTVTWWPEILSKHEMKAIIPVGSIDIFCISLAYSRIQSNIRRDREKKELQAMQLATELKFLRSQISPHFLFNVLTNLVSLARKRSDQLESSLITLAELMRYMLYDAQGKKMPLATEVRYLNSYIDLQKLRFGHDVDVETDIDTGPQAAEYVIEPMLLIPFVENAFKHGVGSVGRPRIETRLTVKEGTMHFEVRNTYDETFSAGPEEHTGLGLNNVRTRLALIYPKDHTLEVKKENNWFHIVLTLKLT